MATTIGETLNANEVHQLKLAAAQDARAFIIRKLREADNYCASGQPVLARRPLGEAIAALSKGVRK